MALPSMAGIDLSITNEVVLVWVAALATLGLLTLAFRRRSLVPKGVFQNLFEGLVDLVQTQIVREGLGPEGAAWAPFLLTLFFFILIGNLLGMVPWPQQVKAATSNLSVTAALAALVFVSTVLINLRRHGWLGFLRKFLPPGLPIWVAVLAVPIEVISWLAKPVSLAIRLFANMMVGHALLLVFIGLELSALWFLAPIPLAAAVLMECFELFVCFIQAFIFTMLAGFYLREAMESH